jgi:nucleotide-binding universal stress UspA family protein
MKEGTEVLMSDGADGSGTDVGVKRVLVAVDDTDGSGRAVSYVADFLGGEDRYRILLFHVLAPPPEDIFPSAKERDAWIADHEKVARTVLSRYREVFVDSGFGAENVETVLCRQEEDSVVHDILRKQSELGSCTVVVGRNSKTRSEEFIFGSVSSRIVREARHCSVWVVE